MRPAAGKNPSSTVRTLAVSGALRRTLQKEILGTDPHGIHVLQNDHHFCLGNSGKATVEGNLYKSIAPVLLDPDTESIGRTREAAKAADPAEVERINAGLKVEDRLKACGRMIMAFRIALLRRRFAAGNILEDVCSWPAGEDGGPCSALQRVVAAAAIEVVVTARAQKDIIAFAAFDGITAAA